MFRVALAAAALMLTANCAHAQARPENEVAARAVANVIFAAMPDEQNASWGFRWDAMSTRVSRFVHWHLHAPDAPDRAPNDIVERSGWLEGDNYTFGVTARGIEAQLLEISIDYDHFAPRTLLDLLRTEGATLSSEGDDESSTYYWVTMPGRAGVRLAMTRRCTPESSAMARRCNDIATVQFDIQEAAPSSP